MTARERLSRLARCPNWLERERSQPYDFEVRPKPKLRKACGKGRSITRTFLALLALAELGALPARAVKRKASFNTSRALKTPTPEIELVAATARPAYPEPQSHRTLLVTVVDENNVAVSSAQVALTAATGQTVFSLPASLPAVMSSA